MAKRLNSVEAAKQILEEQNTEALLKANVAATRKNAEDAESVEDEDMEYEETPETNDGSDSKSKQQSNTQKHYHSSVLEMDDKDDEEIEDDKDDKEIEDDGDDEELSEEIQEYNNSLNEVATAAAVLGAHAAFTAAAMGSEYLIGHADGAARMTPQAIAARKKWKAAIVELKKMKEANKKAQKAKKDKPYSPDDIIKQKAKIKGLRKVYARNINVFHKDVRKNIKNAKNGKKNESFDIDSAIASVGTNSEHMDVIRNHISETFTETDNAELTEDFVNKTAVIFETAVMDRSRQIGEELQEQYNTILEENVARLEEQYQERQERLVEEIDQYLSYAVEEWIKENRLAIETGMRTEITEEFISGLKNLFEESFIDVPEDRKDIMEELHAEIEQTKNELNVAIQENARMFNENKELNKTIIIDKISSGLTMTDKDRLVSLCENVDYTTPEEFASAVETIKESFIDSGVNTVSDETTEAIELTEDSSENRKFTDPAVRNIVEHFNNPRWNKKAK